MASEAHCDAATPQCSGRITLYFCASMHKVVSATTNYNDKVPTIIYANLMEGRGH